MKENIVTPTYFQLTDEQVKGATPKEAERLAIQIIAENARVRGGGQILSWSEFNENPDPLVNRLLARILVSQIDKSILNGLVAEQIAVLSIENSAGYLASEITHELSEKFRLARYPRIIRARKSESGLPPSPAMGELRAMATVRPITSSGRPRYLMASMPDKEELKFVRVLIPVDDFRATGDTLRGGVGLGISLVSQSGVKPENLTVIPMAGLGKPEQEKVRDLSHSGVNLTNILTAIDVKFWPDRDLGEVYIQANGFPALKMRKAKVSDFTNS